MTRTKLRWMFGAVGATGLLFGVTALAWACTGQATLKADRSSGPAGTVVQVTGQLFVPDGRVEIRWDQRSEAVLASDKGPQFNVAITVPGVPARSRPYSILATGYDVNGAEVGRAAVPFTVTAAVPTPQPPPPGPDAPAGVPAPANASPAPGVDPVVAPSATGQAPAPVVTGATSATRRPGAAAVASPARRPGEVAATPAINPAAPAADPLAGVLEPDPAPRTAVGDLWAGFASPGSPLRGPGLDTPPVSQSGDSAPVGLALLVIGASALLAGLALTLVRRRRQPVGAVTER